MLSIIIPTLNEASYLFLLLDSIKKQRFKDYEVIIVDAGSTDKTVDFVKNNGYQVITIAGPAGFPASSRNAGAKIARGNLLFFLDSDSVLSRENFLQETLEEFEARHLDAAGFFLLPYKKNIFYRLGYNFFYNWYPALAFEKSLPHAANAILVKKEVHYQVGGFDEKIRIAEDHAYVREISKKNRFGIIKSNPVYVLTKRFECDGWLKTTLKFLLCELHMVFLGPVKSDIFKYHFGHFDKGKKTKVIEIILWPVGFVILFIVWVLTTLILLLRGLVKLF